MLLSHQLQAQDLSWVSGQAPAPSDEGYAAKTRYRQTDAACSMRVEGSTLSLRFAQAQWAVTPGQSAVLYQGEVCLGGGVITAAGEDQAAKADSLSATA
jgi:tRNA-specific 2-thiouridylase